MLSRDSFTTDGAHERYLRDYFAAHAPRDYASTLFARVEQCEELLGLPRGKYDARIHWPAVESIARYKFADAMIRARESGGAS